MFTAKKLVVLIVGSAVSLVGVALLVLPGPAFIVLPLGLSILATEFIWAQKLHFKVKEKTAWVMRKIKNKTLRKRGP